MTTYSLTLAPSFVNDIMAGGLVSTELVAADSNVSYLFDSRTFPTMETNPNSLSLPNRRRSREAWRWD